VAQPHLRVVDHRREDVVELVRDRRRERAHAAQLLRLHQLLLQLGNPCGQLGNLPL
jgi:hypothetical protein